MTKELTYTTTYNTTRKLKEEVLQQYPHKCIICDDTEHLVITAVLPEEIYTELEREAWNNIPLCRNCNRKLTDYNRKDKNGIRNLIRMLKEQ